MINSIPMEKHVKENQIDNIDDENENGREFPEVSPFRRILPQFLASNAKNLLIWNVGLVLAFPSIVIPALTGLSNNLNPNETLHITGVQASWLASFSFIGQPVGSLLSGVITDAIGRRRTMLIVNIPNALAWLLLAQTETLPVIYFAFGLFGIGAGLMEAPIMTYLSEICEPSIRGVLMACSGISSASGIFMVFSLGSFLSWRRVALTCAIIPFSSIVAVFFVPETPIWLLSKNRSEDALRALQWLRGWVSKRAVLREFCALNEYKEQFDICFKCKRLIAECKHPPPTLLDKIKDIPRKRTLKPLALITILYVMMEFSGMFVMRPYIVQILNAYGIPIEASSTTMILGLLGLVANIFLLFTVKFFGKRKIYLVSICGTFLCCFGLSIYGYIFFPPNWSSFDSSTKNSTVNSDFFKTTLNAGNYSYLALAMFLIMQFCVSFGVTSVPNIVMGEVFPFKLRSFLCGISAANRYILASMATKTYYNVELWLSLPGAIAFYGFISLIGFIVMFFILPETEQRSLEDIEAHYSDNNKRITDIYIPINSRSDIANFNNHQNLNRS